jgi:glutamate synthase domain-containing protein 2
MRLFFVFVSIVIIVGLLASGFYFWHGFYWILAVLMIPIGIGFSDILQTHHAIKRNFPLVGRSRYAAEWLRPKLYQYFVESDTEGAPVPRIYRSIVYQRSKKVNDTTPFGTQLNVYAEGYEWMNHSILPIEYTDIDHDPRVKVGGPDCKKPYDLALLNVSAMSYGSLSANAIKSLNGGAAIGGFAHNTGEGGISSHHMEFGGDLIYQIGTGYFGCRNEEGGFSEENFLSTIGKANVKMVEIKLSQGAKPGHGGILPAKKVTKEIAAIRNVPLGQDVLSPPFHKEFDTPVGLLQFVKRLRDLTEGLPIGFKLCVGHRSEFISICKAMVETGILPDFISVDGGEGGTGAAPLEFSNSVGMPYREGLAIVYDTLDGFDLKQHIKIIAAGKIFTGFHIVRALAIGADACYSARAMMLALGCIQALECNKNTCPVGVATNDKNLKGGLVVSDKKVRVANFQKQTLTAFVELMGAAGIDNPSDINRYHIHRRIIMNRHETYEDVYPYITEGCLLTKETYPEDWKRDMGMASAKSFRPRFSAAYVDED